MNLKINPAFQMEKGNVFFTKQISFPFSNKNISIVTFQGWLLELNTNLFFMFKLINSDSLSFFHLKHFPAATLPALPARWFALAYSNQQIKILNLVRKNSVKGNWIVILSHPTYKDVNARFTTLSLKALSDQALIRSMFLFLYVYFHFWVLWEPRLK